MAAQLLLLACVLAAAAHGALQRVDPGDELFSDFDPVVLLRSAEALDALLLSDRPVVVNFYAPWCVHCQEGVGQINAAALELAGSAASSAVHEVLVDAGGGFSDDHYGDEYDYAEDEADDEEEAVVPVAEPDAVVAVVDCGTASDLCARYEVTKLPTILLFVRDGTRRRVAATPCPLRQWLTPAPVSVPIKYGGGIDLAPWVIETAHLAAWAAIDGEELPRPASASRGAPRLAAAKAESWGTADVVLGAEVSVQCSFMNMCPGPVDLKWLGPFADSLDVDDAEPLVFKEGLGPGEEMAVNTYSGHVWGVYAAGVDAAAALFVVEPSRERHVVFGPACGGVARFKL